MTSSRPQITRVGQRMSARLGRLSGRGGVEQGQGGHPLRRLAHDLEGHVAAQRQAHQHEGFLRGVVEHAPGRVGDGLGLGEVGHIGARHRGEDVDLLLEGLASLSRPGRNRTWVCTFMVFSFNADARPHPGSGTGRGVSSGWTCPCGSLRTGTRCGAPFRRSTLRSGSRWRCPGARCIDHGLRGSYRRASCCPRTLRKHVEGLYVVRVVVGNPLQTRDVPDRPEGCCRPACGCARPPGRSSQN